MEPDEPAYIIPVAFTCAHSSAWLKDHSIELPAGTFTDTCHDLCAPLQRCAVLNRSGWGYSSSRMGRGYFQVRRENENDKTTKPINKKKKTRKVKKYFLENVGMKLQFIGGA